MTVIFTGTLTTGCIKIRRTLIVFYRAMLRSSVVIPRLRGNPSVCQSVCLEYFENSFTADSQ